MNTYLLDEKMRSAVSAAAGLAAVWAVAAAVRPTSTYHLAPLLIAGIAPILARRPERSHSLLAVGAMAGVVIAAGAALGLAAFDLLRGPSLLPYGGALAEAVTFTVLGAVAGFLVGIVVKTR